MIERRERDAMQEALAKGIADLQATVRREGERARVLRQAIGDATKRLRHDDGGQARLPVSPGGKPTLAPRLTLLTGGAAMDDDVADPSLSDLAGACKDTAPSAAPRDTYQGNVRVRLVGPVSARGVVEFVSVLWQQPAFRVRECAGGQGGRVTEVSLELCQPFALEDVFTSLPGVASTRACWPAGEPGAPIIEIVLRENLVVAAVG